MKVHIIALHKIKHVEYALVSMTSLIERGGVKPSDIVFSLDIRLQNWVVKRFLEKYPINIRLVDPPVLQKFIAVDGVFKDFPDCDRVLQLDADTALTRDMDFQDFLSFESKADILAYDYKADGNAQHKNRACCTLPDFRLTSEGLQSYRYKLLVESIFNGQFNDFEKWLGAENTWVYGGFILINRSIFEKPIWQKMKMMGVISNCDETIIQLARWASENQNEDFVYQPLQLHNFEHVVNPKELDFNDPRGMVHWAGEWYRAKNETNRDLIDAKINETIESYIK